jgi:uncharacterized membrane protein (UPF0127 family)
MHRFIAFAVLVALVGVAAACSGGPSDAPAITPTASVVPVTFPTGTLEIHAADGDHTLHIEIATNGEQSQRGLGFRDGLADDAGMLFDLGSTRPQVFWMKGMRFALDFVWITDDKRVAGVTADVPPQPGVPDSELLTYSAPQPVRYVLEINAGAAARLGIAPGTQLSFGVSAE